MYIFIQIICSSFRRVQFVTRLNKLIRNGKLGRISYSVILVDIHRAFDKFLAFFFLFQYFLNQILWIFFFIEKEQEKFVVIRTIFIRFMDQNFNSLIYLYVCEKLFCFLFQYTFFFVFFLLVGLSQKRNANVFRHLSLSRYHILSLSHLLSLS